MDDLVVKGGGFWRVALVLYVTAPATLRANHFVVSVAFRNVDRPRMGSGLGYWKRPWTSVTEVRISDGGNRVMLRDDEGKGCAFVALGGTARRRVALLEELARTNGVTVTRGEVFFSQWTIGSS